MRGELSEQRQAKLKGGFKVLDFTKETKSEVTVAFTGGFIYKYRVQVILH